MKRLSKGITMKGRIFQYPTPPGARGDMDTSAQGDRMMKRIMKLVLITAVILSLGAGCGVVKHYPSYYGRVIDAETKEPLEGAAVLAVYYTEKPSPGGPVSFYREAQETVTDKNGEFKIPSITLTTFKFVHFFDPHPQFTIFKPGYGSYPRHKDVRPMFVPNGSLPANKHVTIELPVLKTKQERKENLCGRDLDAPLSKQKNLIILLNQERKYLGYESFYQED